MRHTFWLLICECSLEKFPSTKCLLVSHAHDVRMSNKRNVFSLRSYAAATNIEYKKIKKDNNKSVTGRLDNNAVTFEKLKRFHISRIFRALSLVYYYHSNESFIVISQLPGSISSM